MTPEIDKIIKGRIAQLPKSITDSIKILQWMEKVRDISKANNLSNDKIPLFETETILVILGFESLKNYPENLVEKVGIDNDTAISIAKAVDKEIIQTITGLVNKNEEPTVITVENKELALKDLPQKTQNNKSEPSTLETSPTNLPMVEKGEVAHEVPHVEQSTNPPVIPQNKTEQPKIAPLPDYRYPDGKDPYREPLK